MPYRYLEDVATADAAFEVEGGTPKELFRDAAIATFEVMADTKSVNPEITKEIELKNEDIGNLLFDWLSELVYLKDAESLLFSSFDVSVKKNDIYELKAKVRGEHINQRRHSLRSDVKAVTYHMFEVKRTGEKWTATVVLDI